MECGKLTAKLRDAVPVCFIENGKEIKRFKNIEIPDEIKVLPFADFKFDAPMSGAITFKIMFEVGILPTEWPQARERKSRSAKAALAAAAPTEQAKADEAKQEAEQETTALAIIQPDPLAAIIEAAGQADSLEAMEPQVEQPAEEAAQEPEVEQPAEIMAEEAAATPEEPSTMEIAYHVTGEQRKALVKTVSSFTGEAAKYQNAPTFTFIIGAYAVDKNGTLTGPASEQLLQALAAQNFIEE